MFVFISVHRILLICRDCFVCSALVGESGHVTGIDMTEEQNEVTPLVQ